MHVTVVDHHRSGRRRTFVGGAPAAARWLVATYPWLAVKHPEDVDDASKLVAHLDRAQAHSAQAHDTGPLVVEGLGKSEVAAAQFGRAGRFAAALRAAAWLAGEAGRPAPDARGAYLDAEGDPQVAALRAFQLPETYLPALRYLLEAGELAKAHPTLDIREVVPLDATSPQAEAYAEIVRRAAGARMVTPLHLHGVHSAGTLEAVDPQTHAKLILKHGAGGQGVPAAAEVYASEAKREAASWAVLDACGLGACAPEAHLLLLDGREVAAMRMLDFDYRGLDEAQRTDPGLPRRLLRLYLSDGGVHRWAAMDFILGQTDRHAGNLMYRGADVQLIDWGSALAGPDFAPGVDRRTFIPFYLRAFAPGDFPQLPLQAKISSLPRLPAAAEPAFRAWLAGLPREAIAGVLYKYGIPPGACLARLDRLRGLSASMPADLVVNTVWCGG